MLPLMILLSVSCGNESAGLDRPPLVRVWKQGEMPSTCAGWTSEAFTSLVTTSAQFRFAGSAQDLLARIGAISELRNVRYWSTTHQRWQTLIVDAHALNGAQPRKNFSPNEMKPGQFLNFEQTDALTGQGRYRMHIAEVSETRIVYDVENLSTLRYMLVPTFHPGDLKATYFLDRESEGVWNYYSILRTGKNASRLKGGHEASSINRAVALYRHLAGIPTDQEPPAAR
jgi:hypothetical protein